MKKTAKKILAIVLTAVMAITAIPLPGFELPDLKEIFTIKADAAENYTERFYTYTVANGEAQITDCDTSASGAITIPTTLGGYPVTSIGNDAFLNCINITGITIPNCINVIGSWAFSDCTSLDNIVISNSIVSIGDRAFQNTGYSNNSNNWENGVLYIGECLISQQLLNSYTPMTEYTIKDGTTTIADYVFYHYTPLEKISFPKSIKNIGSSAFDYCVNLTSIIIPDSVTSIGFSAFNNCNSLTDVYYGGSESKWNNITIGRYNEDLLNATICFNSTGPVIEEPTTNLDEESTATSVDSTTKPVEESTIIPTESTTKPTEPPTTKPDSTTIPADEVEIQNPSQTEISYGDKIVLHMDVDLPAGAKVVWHADNGNFSKSVSPDGKTCTITPVSSGDTEFTAYVVKDGKVISEEYSVTMTAKAGFFQKIIAFFKGLFGLNKVITQAVKFAF